MNPVKKLLFSMKGRVPMYIGSTSLKHLAMFLRGFEHGLDVSGISHDNFITTIADNVRSRFEYKDTKSWEDVLTFHASNDENAMNEFWVIFDEICATHAD